MPGYSMSSPSCHSYFQHQNRVPEPEPSFDGEASVELPTTTRSGIRSSALPTAMVAMAVLIAGCGVSPEPRPTSAEPTSKDTGTTTKSPQPLAIAGLGAFPEFPEVRLAGPVAGSFQAVLDGAVEQGTVRGVTASVIVADIGRGSWSGASGADYEGKPLTPDAGILIGSVGKTVTAAQVLRLVEEGKLGLDDPISDYLPREVASFDLNGATIREVLGMRSGIPDPPDYGALVDSGSTVAELLRRVSEPLFPAGSDISYANINYILLGTVIEHITGRHLWGVLRSDVLDRPGLDGLVYGVKDAMAADGWRIESDTASLARWGYELYGGFVLSDVSLGHMADFRGDFYGLGAIDYSLGTPVETGYGITAIGHGGLEPGMSAALVAFPQARVVVVVQALTGDLEKVHSIVRALKDAAEA